MHTSLDYPLPAYPKKKKRAAREAFIERPHIIDITHRATDHEEDHLVKMKKYRHSRGSKRKKKKITKRQKERGVLNVIGQLKTGREREAKLLQCGFWCGDRLSVHRQSETSLKFTMDKHSLIERWSLSAVHLDALIMQQHTLGMVWTVCLCC